MKRAFAAAFAILLGCGTAAVAQSQDRGRSANQSARIVQGDPDSKPYGDTSQLSEQRKAMANYGTGLGGHASYNGTDRFEMMKGQGRYQVGYRHFRRTCAWHHGRRACYRSYD